MSDNPPAAATQSAWSDPLLTPGTGAFAAFALAASLVLPMDGFGLDLCMVHRVSGLPCPGCGLTRAFIAVTHGDLSTAVALNPFVLILYPLFAALVAAWLAPAPVRSRMRAWLAGRPAAVARAYRISILAFVGFGAARFAWFLAAGERFP